MCLDALDRVRTAATQEAVPHVWIAASRLAVNRVPAGFVLPDQAFERRPTIPVTPTTADQRAAFRASLGAFLEAFGREQGNQYVVDATGDVLYIRSRDVPPAVDDLLNRQIDAPQANLSVADAEMLLPELIQGERRGMAGVGSPFKGCNWTQIVPASPGRTSVKGYLDHLVTAVPGFVWFVTFKPSMSGDTLAVALGCGSGMFTKIALAP
jgi:hypothetical protein